MKFPEILILLAILTLMTFQQTISAQTPKIETGVSQSLAKWRAANYSDVRYKLNITLEKGAPLMKGEIEIRVNLTETGAKNSLILDWRTTQFANDKDKPYADVFEINGTPVNGSGIDNRILFVAEHITIAGTLLKKGENVIKIKFASPIKTSGAAVTRYVDKEDNAEYIYSLFVPSDASTAFPVFDQPDLKARFQLTVTLYNSDWSDNYFNKWKVISNTPTKIAYETERSRNFSFAETKPISTYVFAFAAGDFAEVSVPPALAGGSTPTTENLKKNGSSKKSDVTESKVEPPANAGGTDLPTTDDLPMKIYVRKSQAGKLINAPTGSASIPACHERESANNTVNKRPTEPQQTRASKDACAPIDEIFRLNREAIKFLEDWFDYKFPFPKYDLVLIPEFPFGGMEHAGATFLREDRVIFPTEPTKNDFITRANLIFHEAAHQWFGDTVTMRWFDDLWLKEGFAEFMAYKTLEKVLPEYNAWKVFYERNKQAAYLTDVTRGTTPIYQEIPNLSSAKSAYGNIVYRKAPSFLKQAEFYLGEKEFQTAVRAFLKKHEFANAEWTDLVKEFETAGKQDLKNWANFWVKNPGVRVIRGINPCNKNRDGIITCAETWTSPTSSQLPSDFVMPSSEVKIEPGEILRMKLNMLFRFPNGTTREAAVKLGEPVYAAVSKPIASIIADKSTGQQPVLIFPNYQDYGYGIFLLDEKSRAYILSNIQNEKDDFLRSMMWGSLWDAVRFYELAPEEYVKLVIKNINVEQDESTIQSLLGRVSTAMNYYLSEPPAVAGGLTPPSQNAKTNSNTANAKLKPSATADGSDLQAQLEKLLINKIETAPTIGQKITYFRALQSIGSSDATKKIFKDLLNGKSKLKDVELKTKDKFDLVTRLIILGDKDALNILANLEKTETDDAAKRYAYAAKAGIPTAENKLKYWKDFTENKEISENWIESAFGVWNTPRHADLTLPYLEKALAELPNLKRTRKIFFVNGWLSSFIGGQKSEQALNIVNKFLADNPNLDADLQRKILENSDNLERAVKIRAKFGK